MMLFRHRDGRFLLQFRDGSPKVGALKFSFFGGSIDQDDADAVAAVKRKALEELNIQLMNGEVEAAKELVHPIRGTPLFVHGVKLRILDRRFIVKEGAGAVFLTLDELLMLHSRRDWLTPPTALVVEKIVDGTIKLD